MVQVPGISVMSNKNHTACFCLRLGFRVVGCLVVALCATMVLSRTLGAAFDAVPVRLVTWLVRTCSPDTVIDGETAYDVRLGDSTVFYGFIFFLIIWFVYGWVEKDRCSSQMHS